MPYHSMGGYNDQGSFLSSIGGFLGHLGTAAIDVVTGNVGSAIGQVGAAVGLGGSGKPAPYPTLPAAPGGGSMSSSTSVATVPAGAQHKGYHLNRSKYYTKAGVVEKGTKYVKNRRTNYADGRALARANRRVDGFVRLAKRSLKHTKYHLATTRHHAGRASRRAR